jgi:hypothetical protein
VASPVLSGDHDVAGFSAVSLSSANVVFAGRNKGETEGLFGIRPLKGSVLPPFTRGRAPRTSDEIAFGATTLRELHLGVGGWVNVGNGHTHRHLHITGQMVLTPSVVKDQVPMGHGALMTLSGLRALHASAPVNVFLVRFTQGGNRKTTMAELQREFPGTVFKPLLPPTSRTSVELTASPRCSRPWSHWWPRSRSGTASWCRCVADAATSPFSGPWGSYAVRSRRSWRGQVTTVVAIGLLFGCRSGSSRDAGPGHW